MANATRKLRYAVDAANHRPMYLQLRDQIIGDIRLGRFAPGAPIPSISALEAMTSASRVTIIRALNVLAEDGFVFPQHGKGYYVANRAERTLLAVVAPFELRTMHYSSQLLAGVELSNRALDYDILEADSHLTIREFEAATRCAIYERGARWLLLVPPVETPEVAGDFVDSLKGGCRIVVADRDVPTRHPVLLQDRAAAYRLLAEHCAAQGFHEAATMGFAAHPPTEMRSLHKALKLCGLNVRTKEPVSMGDIAALAPEIDVLLCADDFPAARVFERFQEGDGHAPFAITGFNNTVHAHCIPGGLTTIDPNLLEMGRLAARMLAGDVPGEGQRISPRLVVGASTNGWQA